MVDDATAESLLTKLRDFAGTLDDDERELFAVLVGPGVMKAVGNTDVEGFSFSGREHDRLARGLIELYRRERARAEDDIAGNRGVTS
jgi:hypothetical protein